MDLQDLGSLGELIAAIATVITLIYLAIQIRQNTRSLRLNAFRESNESLNNLNVLAASDKQIARLWRVGTSMSENLDQDEQAQFEMLCLSLFRVYENMFIQFTDGTEEKLWTVIGKDLEGVMSQPGILNWWQNNPYSFTPEFTSFVNSMAPIPA